MAIGRAQLPARDRRLRPDETLDARLRSRGSDARLHEQRLDDRRRLQRLVRQRPVGAAVHRLPGARRARRPTATARSSASRPRSACASATTPSASRRTASRPTPTSSAFEATVGTDARPVGDRAGLPAARMDGGRPPLFPLPDGQRRSSTSSPFQSARYAVRKDRWNDVAIEIYYQPGHEYNLERDDRGDEGRARLLHGGIRPVSVPAVPHHRVPALRDVRPIVPEHDSVFRRRSASSRACATTTRTTSTTRTT